MRREIGRHEAAGVEMIRVSFASQQWPQANKQATLIETLPFFDKMEKRRREETDKEHAMSHNYTTLVRYAKPILRYGQTFLLLARAIQSPPSLSRLGSSESVLGAGSN
jgi:hypothetical protein